MLSEMKINDYIDLAWQATRPRPAAAAQAPFAARRERGCAQWLRR